PRRADQRGDLARPDLQIDVAHGTVVAVEHGEAADVEHEQLGGRGEDRGRRPCRSDGEIRWCGDRGFEHRISLSVGHDGASAKLDVMSRAATVQRTTSVISVSAAPQASGSPPGWVTFA